MPYADVLPSLFDIFIFHAAFIRCYCRVAVITMLAAADFFFATLRLHMFRGLSDVAYADAFAPLR